MPPPTGPSRSSPSLAGIHSLLDRLLATTEQLLDSTRAFAPNQASDLLARRQQLTASLQSALQGSRLTPEQRHKLQRAAKVGEQARQSLLIKRETARSQLQEGLAGRHRNESFKPYRPKKKGRLNIKL